MTRTSSILGRGRAWAPVRPARGRSSGAALAFAGLALVLGVTPAACSDDDGGLSDAGVDASRPDASPDAEAPLFPHPARVLRIIDGDTIEVRYQGVEMTVRFLGINCPELTPTPEPYGEEAKQFTAQHALPTYDVGLEFDDDQCANVPTPAGCLDIYDRLLAYIRTASQEDLSALLLANGLARVYTASTCGRQSAYLQIQAQAQVDGVGIWSQ